VDELKANKALLDARGKREARRAKRLKKYEELGQFKNGVYFCKGGIPIDEERLRQYDDSCYFMIQKFCPRQSIHEASFDYEDLMNRCRLEVFMALLNGWDPKKALKGKCEVSQKWKDENREIAIARAERGIVKGRLINYFRRTLWTYHPDQFGGCSTSYDEICEGIHQEYRQGVFREQDPLAFSRGVQHQLDGLLLVLRREGKEAAKEKFLHLGEDMREKILMLIKEKNSVEIFSLESGV